MGVFYPSCVVHFILRFDEAFNVSEQASAMSVSAAQGLVVDPYTPSIRPLILESEAAKTNKDVEATTGVKLSKAPGDQDRLSIIMNRVPKAGSFELTGYRQAWKFNMSFDFRDLPVDPRVIRSCGVEIHIGAVDPSDFASGMVSTDAQGRRKSIISTVGPGGAPREDTLIMVALVDTAHVSHTANSSVLTIEGRDLRGVFLDSPADPKLFKNLNLDRDIVDVVRQILQRHPFGKGINVESNKNDWPDSKVPSPYTKDNATRVLLGADGKGSGSSMPQGGSANLNFWDLITHYCFVVGAVPYFAGRKLVIRPARSLYDQQKAGFDPRIPTPFAGGRQRSAVFGEPGREEKFGVRKLIFGRDVSELSYERKYTGVKARVVAAVGVDTSSEKRGTQALVTGYWPNAEAIAALKREQKEAEKRGQALALDKAQQTLASVASVVAKLSNPKATSVAPSGGATQEEVLRVPVAGIKDKKTLEEIARNIFEEVGKGEMGGSAHTKNLASFGTDPNSFTAANADPDLCRLRPGDAVELKVDTRRLASTAPLVSSVTDFYRKSVDDITKEVGQKLKADLGSTAGSEDLARVVVATARGGIVELQNVWRVENVKYDWSVTGGLGVAFDFKNYIEARSNVNSSTGKNTAPTKTVAAGGPKR